MGEAGLLRPVETGEVPAAAAAPPPRTGDAGLELPLNPGPVA